MQKKNLSINENNKFEYIIAVLDKSNEYTYI